jgi:hypothetical protein
VKLKGGSEGEPVSVGWGLEGLLVGRFRCWTCWAQVIEEGLLENLH